MKTKQKQTIYLALMAILLLLAPAVVSAEGGSAEKSSVKKDAGSQAFFTQTGVSPSGVRLVEYGGTSLQGRVRSKPMFDAPPVKPKEKVEPVREEPKAAEAEAPRRLPKSKQVTEEAAPAKPLAEEGNLEASVMLFEQKSPTVVVKTEGPRNITVNRPAVYDVIVENTGKVAADDMVVSILLPASVDIQQTRPSVGSTRAAQVGQPFAWTINRLAPGTEEKLSIRVIPRDRRPVKLGVSWTSKPALVQTAITVQQPALEMSIAGPAEVHFRKQATFKLSLRNPGNGSAENVIVTLLSSDDTTKPSSKNIGSLQPNEEKIIPIDLIACRTGTMDIQVAAQCDGGVKASVEESVLVRCPELQVDVKGPEMKYVGGEAQYTVVVKNTGNAQATNIKAKINIPPGVRYVSGIANAQMDPQKFSLGWDVNTLPAGQEVTYMPVFRLEQAEETRIEMMASADGRLTASGHCTTLVESIADLQLAILKPKAPVEVGKEARFEIVIRNNGTKEATNVEIGTLLGAGLEVVSIEGDNNPMVGSQKITFNTIPMISPRGEHRITLYVKSKEHGNKSLRAELVCRSINANLLSQESTYFYQSARSKRTAQAPKQGADVELPRVPETAKSGSLSNGLPREMPRPAAPSTSDSYARSDNSSHSDPVLPSADDSSVDAPRPPAPILPEPRNARSWAPVPITN